jgi:hypothetical protein
VATSPQHDITRSCMCCGFCLQEHVDDVSSGVPSRGAACCQHLDELEFVTQDVYNTQWALDRAAGHCTVGMHHHGIAGELRDCHCSGLFVLGCRAGVRFFLYSALHYHVAKSPCLQLKVLGSLPFAWVAC